MGSDEDDLEKSLNELDARMAQMLGGGNRGVGSVKVNVSAGGTAVWISTLCAVLGFALFVMMGLLYLDHSRKIDRMQDHLSAIYMQAPHLRPKEE